ncbi:hypothetical protein K9U39_02990 [Rhodoblastus acidophilus]|uniref:Uncharacterized protein n=1 Tax=Candidatus Rhodoblastus alkanivorans TaxID=2954117 RepID=A0ABS9Z4K8_9HYPH|nr:hypothetical protein [Candidatus Rhodoblastus alkanivorans]MCI4677653.1 hypothetical protein [Candidatus Rhodoblastus alkanivorans]MCI4682615.1 hypothetical protein [Candidatus Rhodoblastus alkanivorans]MDI4639921.1 hypothetical protein [Rhodoblastus acidophilus]
MDLTAWLICGIGAAPLVGDLDFGVEKQSVIGHHRAEFVLCDRFLRATPQARA